MIGHAVKPLVLCFISTLREHKWRDHKNLHFAFLLGCNERAHAVVCCHHACSPPLSPELKRLNTWTAKCDTFLNYDGSLPSSYAHLSVCILDIGPQAPRNACREHFLNVLSQRWPKTCRNEARPACRLGLSDPGSYFPLANMLSGASFIKLRIGCNGNQCGLRGCSKSEARGGSSRAH